MSDKNSENTPMGLKKATQKADRLFGFFPPSSASDPEIFMTGVVNLLATYPEWVAERIMSTTTGLPAKHTFLPSIKEIREACEAEYSVTRRAIEWEAMTREQTKLLAGPPSAPRPTYDELRAKYGDNWGLKTSERGAKWSPRSVGEIAAEIKEQFSK